MQQNSLSRSLFYSTAIGLSVSLSACQSTLKTPVLTTKPPSQQTITNQFSISGKIGVRTPQQNGSAFYAWTQVNDYFAIDLTGALGIGQTRIEGTPGQVSLTSAKTGTLQASTPEELLEKATGWQAPISYLSYWVQGKPANATTQIQIDEQNRLKQLNEGGWQVQFSYEQNQPLPQKLIMLQQDAAQTGSANRVTLTIQTRSDKVQ